MRVLNLEEQQRLVTYLLTDMDEAKFGVLLALLTGMRIGEVCALKWEDISVDERVIHISSTMQRLQTLDRSSDTKTKVTVGEAKSHTSNRIIPLNDSTAALCKKMQVFNGNAYVCDTYHRYGKEHCSSHMVDEETLDSLIGAEILRTKKMYEENWSRMEWLIERWTPKASTASAKISKLQEHILLLEEEVEVILMERIRDKANAERYDRMIVKREEQIAEVKKQIEELQNTSEMLRSRQAKLKRDISLIDDILRESKMSEAHLRMLVEKILVHEEDGRLDLEIRLKAPFRDHLDVFENGAQTDCFPTADFDYDRLGAAIYGDYYAG